MWRKNITCLLLLLFQIFTISGNILPRDVVIGPTFQRSSVEHVPQQFEMDNLSAKILLEDPEKGFSRLAVESVPSTIVSEFLPLRSAVEYMPPYEDEAPSAHAVSFKKNFMDVVTSNKKSNLRTNPPNSIRVGAYSYPTQYNTKQPQQFRAGSPFQEIVEPQTKRIRKPVTNQRVTDSKKRSSKKVICFVTSWSFYRKDDGHFVPERIDTNLCSHIVYSYASLDPETLTTISFDPWGDLSNQLYQRAVANANANGVPIMLGLGGWTDSHGDKYTQLVSNPTNRKKFISETISFLNMHGFAGLHIDWNYPVCWQSDCSEGPASDKADFTKLIQELSQEFAKRGLILSTSISGYREIIVKAYDMKALSKAVDFMTVMTYDYHGSWESKTGHVSPLFGDADDDYPQYNTDHAMQLLVKMGADKEKLIMGVPFYGQTFELATFGKALQGFGSPAVGPGNAGEFTRQPGMLGYNEMCYLIKSKGYKVGKDETGKSGPFATKGNQWFGFDDILTMIRKVDYVKEMGFGGVAAWTIDLDDFQNRCCSENFPLLKAINRGLGRLKNKPPTGKDCTRPPAPITPTPPPMTTPSDDEGSWSSPSMWGQPSTSEATTRRTTTEETTKVTRSTTERTTRQPVTAKPDKPEDETTTLPVPGVVMPVFIADDHGYCESNAFKAHETNCNAYYICVNNELLQQYCSGGLHWNSQQNLCDWPASAKCNVHNDEEEVEEKTTKAPTRRTTTRTTTKKRTTKKQTTEPTTTTTVKTTTKRSTTRATPTTTKRVSKRTTTSTRRTTSSKTTQRTTTTTTKKPTKKPNRKPTREKCENGKYYPHNECEFFSICINNRKVPQQCPDGLHWNQEETTCDWPEKVRCVSSKQYLRLINAREEDFDLDNPCGSRSFAANPGNCEQYFICDHNHLIEQNCPPGLHWNDEASVCDWPENAQCDGATSQNEEGSPETIDSSENGVDMDYDIDEISYKPPPSTTTTTQRPAPMFPVTVVENEVEPLSGYYKMVCYYTNWSWYRKGLGKYVPENINTDLCTHIVYGFAVLDYSELTIKTHDSWADLDNKFYERVVALKERGVKVSLAIGGWNDSEGDKYSRLVRSKKARAKFITHVIEFLERFGFEGLDLDWEYPKCWQVDCTKGFPDEKERFADFVRELSDAFVPRGLLLSAAVSPSKKVIDEGYDIPTLSDYFDWIAVMCYDYHGQWDKKTGHVAPLYYHPDDDIDYFNSNYTMHYWIEQGAPRDKLVMGMPLYGQAFTLSDPKNNGLNANAPGPGKAGEFTRAAGFLSYYEICDRILNQGWTVVRDPKGRMGPYAYKGNQWVSFDDQETLRRKSQYIRAMELAGGMVWALDLDDFNNRCGLGHHPLLKVIVEELRDPPSGEESIPPLLTHNEEIDEDNEVEEEHKDPMPDEEESSNNNSDTDETEQESKPDLAEKPEPEEEDTDENPDENTNGDNEIDGSEEESEEEEYKVVCYYTNWPWYRPGIGKYVPGDINPELCTHIVYGFAVLNRDTLTIKPHDSWADIDNHFYEKVVEFKNKGIRVSIAIGGWNDSAGDKYSKLVRDAAARARFVKHVVEFIEKHGFEGLDLDWEYPVCWQVDCEKGYPDEKEHFAELVKELSDEFRPRGLLLSAAVSPSQKVIDAGYDIPTLSEYFDWIAVMCYDYHGQWDKKTGHVAPMYEHPDDFDKGFNANYTMNYWISGGADPKKLIMGMPMYGQSFSLANKENNGLNAPTYGGGEAGQFTRARGFLSYYEICTRIKKSGWEVVRDRRGRMGPYARKGDQWVSFDDIGMIRHKSEYVKAMGLGGAMIWALDLDDFRNVCDCEEYPLLKTINRVLRNYEKSAKTCKLESAQEVPTMTYNHDDPDDNKPSTGSRPTQKPKPKPKPTRSKTTKQTTKQTQQPTKSTRQPTKTTKRTRPTRKTTTAKPYTPVHEEDFAEDHEEDSLEEDNAVETGFRDEESNCGWKSMFSPHKTDCSKYYVCEHGRPLEQSCTNGLYWNKDRCDWPQASDCKKTQKPADAVNDEEESEEVTKKPIRTTTSGSEADDMDKPHKPTRKPATTKATSKPKPTSPRPKPTTTKAVTKPKPTKKPLYDQEDISPPVLTGNNEYKMICYFTNWAWYRPGEGKYLPDHIDETLCTHIVYGFAVLNSETLTIRTHDSWADIDNKFYTRVSDYKEKGIKVSLALGGWNDSKGDKYSRLVRSPEARARFIEEAVKFIEKFGFEGLDLDWEYPVCWQVECNKGHKDEKEHFAELVKELSEEFRPRGWSLSAAVSPSKTVIDLGYDIPTLSDYFDWIAVMCYDYHGQWDKKTGHVAPLYYHPDDDISFFNTNFTIHYWIEQGAPREKLMMGMPMYGQSFTLENQNNNGLNAKAPGPGQAGKYTRAAGFLAYYEICEKILQTEGWTVVKDPEGRMGPYAYNGRQWVSYDDVETIRRKTQYIKDMKLGGGMIWALDLDDFRGRCGCGRHPLLRTINLELGRISTARIDECA